MKVYEIFLKNGKSYIFGADDFEPRNGKIYFYNTKKYFSGDEEKTYVAVFEEHSIIGFVIKEL